MRQVVRSGTVPGMVAAVLFMAAGICLSGQGRSTQPQSGPLLTGRGAAPIDLTGYWVSVITEDWRWRMVMPAKGDYASVPLTLEAKKIADSWDPAKDEASGEQCKSYGAAGIMRVPGRLHITWADEKTLKVETDAGMQTRFFHFGSWKSSGGKPTWQGDSVAEWGTPPTPGQGGATANGAAAGEPSRPKYGHLKVVTTHMRPGYLRKNGIPYSADAVLTEYWDLHKERNGDVWMVITTLVDDAKYLQQQYVTSPNFKKEPDAAKWDPVPCTARW
jgi:hypothetical protein